MAALRRTVKAGSLQDVFAVKVFRRKTGKKKKNMTDLERSDMATDEMGVKGNAECTTARRTRTVVEEARARASSVSATRLGLNRHCSCTLPSEPARRPFSDKVYSTATL